MNSLETVIANVNTAVPYHNRAAVGPGEIAATRAASCFGRAALIGAALLGQGLPAEQLSLLISEAHGMQRPSGAYWFGHAELVVDTPEQARLVLTTPTAMLGNLGTTNWQNGVPAEEQTIITGVASLPRASELLPQAEVAAYMGLSDPDFQIRKDQYRAYPFEAGVLHYQTAHPNLNSGPSAQVADYAALYAKLTRPHA